MLDAIRAREKQAEKPSLRQTLEPKAWNPSTLVLGRRGAPGFNESLPKEHRRKPLKAFHAGVKRESSPVSDPTSRQPHSRSEGWGDKLLLFGALSLLALSAAMNVRHAINPKAEIGDTAESAALTLVVTLGFVFLPSFAIRLSREGAHWLSVSACLGAALCGAISFTNLVGSAMKSRLTNAAEVSAVTSRTRESQKAMAGAEAELAKLPPTRPKATIEAEISSKLSSRRDLEGCNSGWLASAKARAVCGEVAQLRSELGLADRRTHLESVIVAERVKLSGIDAFKTIGSPDTAAVVLAAQRFGLTLDGETIDLLKGIGTALSVELFAALLFAGWERSRQGQQTQATHALPVDAPTGHTSPTAQSSALNGAQSSPQPPPPVDAQDAVSTGPPPVSAQTPEKSGVHETVGSVQKLAVAPSPGERLCQLLNERGGEVFGGHRTFALALGISHGHVANVFTELVNAGRIDVQASKRGTRVRLVDYRPSQGSECLRS